MNIGIDWSDGDSYSVETLVLIGEDGNVIYINADLHER